MPVRTGRDAEGPFFQWGKSGRRYRYDPENDTSRRRARARALAQGRAVRASGYGATMALDDTFIPTKGAADMAALASDKRAEQPKSQRGMTAVGLRRMGQIANREPMSVRTLRRVLGYLSRHLVDKDGETWADWGKGRQAWNGWGGDPMGRWAIRTLRQHDTEWFTKWAKAPRNRRLMRHLGR